ncbi:MAG: acetyl-CoA carboxylase biotin carboxyl carrier protein subunit [Bacteroidota bacterium]
MYKATIDENTSLSVEVKGSQIYIGEQSVDLDIHRLSATEFHVIYQHRSYRLEIVEADYSAKKFAMLINGKKVSVALQSELDRLLETLGMDATLESVVKEVRSPMPGLIRTLNVQEGDSVEPGDKLLTLEAMKMENAIKSPSSGTIASVMVETGQSVEKNQVLVSFG